MRRAIAALVGVAAGACGGSGKAPVPVANRVVSADGAAAPAETVDQVIAGMAAAYAALPTFAIEGSIVATDGKTREVRLDAPFAMASTARGTFRIEFAHDSIEWTDGTRERYVVGDLEIPLVDRPANLTTDDFEQLALEQWASGHSELTQLDHPKLVGVEARDGATCWHIADRAGRTDAWIDERDHHIREVIAHVDGTSIETTPLVYDVHYRNTAHPITTAEPPPGQQLP